MTYWEKPLDMVVIRNPGIFHWRSGGEKHINDPVSIASLQVNIIFTIKKYLFTKIFLQCFDALNIIIIN